jgi:hypothetical protein
MITSPAGHIFKIPSAPFVLVEVPAQSYRLAMLGKYPEAFEIVFEYDNFRLDELQHDNDFNFFGVFETPKGFTRLPLISEFWGMQLQNLVDAVKNNIRCND